MSRLIRKSHNVTILIYHIVCRAKYRRIIKSITAREVCKRAPQVKKQLWGGECCSGGYYMASVGQHANEEAIRNYVQQQGHNEYQQLHSQQLRLL